MKEHYSRITQRVNQLRQHCLMAKLQNEADPSADSQKAVETAQMALEAFLNEIRPIIDRIPEDADRAFARLVWLNGYGAPIIAETSGTSQRTVYRRMNSNTAFVEAELKRQKGTST